jgi:hypothetical protein
MYDQHDCCNILQKKVDANASCVRLAAPLTKTLDTYVLACDFGPIMDAPCASQITDGYVGWFQAQPTMRLLIIHKNLLPLNPIRTY